MILLGPDLYLCSSCKEYKGPHIVIADHEPKCFAGEDLVYSPRLRVNKEAKRNPIEFRFDLLIPEFLEELAKLASIGAKKYGERNWQQSRLVCDKSPLNHGIDHILKYQKGIESDVLEGKEGQLVSCAFNCMMEWWYEKKKRAILNESITGFL